jgi:hypothetical protein
VLGLSVALNALLQSRQASPKNPGWSLKLALRHCAQVFGMLFFMAFLWSYWTYPASEEHNSTYLWWNFVTRASSSPPLHYLHALLLFATLFAAAVIAHFIVYRPFIRRLWVVGGFYGHLAITSLILLPLALISIPTIQQSLLNNTSLEVNEIVTADLNEQDKERLLQGYYEQVTMPSSGSGLILPSSQHQNEDWVDGLPSYARIFVDRKSLSLNRLKPLVDTTVNGKRITTNRWGMRDKHYELSKSDNTFRIALLGGSCEMGWGVDDSEVAEALLEQRLNALAKPSGSCAVEVLNFSVPGYVIIQQTRLLSDRVAGFQPDALVVVGTQSEIEHLGVKLPKLLQREELRGMNFVEQLVAHAGINRTSSADEIRRKARPYLKQMITWGYRTLVDSCIARSITPVWAYIPVPGFTDVNDQRLFEETRTLVDSLGYMIMNLSPVFDQQYAKDLWIDESDRHPNAEAHRIIAVALEQEFVRLQAELGLWKYCIDRDH